MNKRFLLGQGERLTSLLKSPLRNPEKAHPYTNRDELYERLQGQISNMSEYIFSLPSEYCPNDESVFCIDLHPAYLSKSYFPGRLLNKLDLRPIGSRMIHLVPNKWTKKGSPEDSPTIELFVAATKKNIEKIAEQIKEDDVFDDIRKIERIRSFDSGERLKGDLKNSNAFEVVLHARVLYDDYIVAGLNNLAKKYGFEVLKDKRIYTSDLCFIPMKGSGSAITGIEKYSFLRIARAMPKMRNIIPVCRDVSPAEKIEIDIPEYPQDNDIKIAVFDGGCVVPDKLKNYISAFAWKDTVADEDGQKHGSQVNSALLFGHIEKGKEVQHPFAKVDNYRVYCKHDGEENPFELYDVIGRIKQVITEKQYDFINLSIGPDLPIDDNEVHAWTATLDEVLSNGKTLLTIAAGNNGAADVESGNARIQVPSDSVNALAIGSSSRFGDDLQWDRAFYSAFGPGRSPGKIKPDILAFGGVTDKPFLVLANGKDDEIVGTMGTSFSAPSALRLGVGLKSSFKELSPLAIKCLLVHRANRKSDDLHKHDSYGWGCIPNNIDDFVVCKDGEVTVLYQGVLDAGKYIKAPIPLPKEDLDGMVTLSATFCYATDVDSKDPFNYTKSGLEVRLRPKISKNDGKDPQRPKTRSFFDSENYATESELRNMSLKWETVLHGTSTMNHKSLEEPFFEIHYMARSGGASVSKADKIPYALLVTLKAPKVKDIYDQVASRYINELSPIVQKVSIQLRT